MKVIIFILGLVALSAPLQAVRAIDVCALGTACNPLRVNLIPDPVAEGRAQQLANSNTELRLRGQYGSAAFSGCDRNRTGDSSDPRVRATQLQLIETCLRFLSPIQQPALLQPVYIPTAQLTTPDYDTGCQKSYGSFAKWTGRFENQRYVCDCKTGSQWNEAKTACTLPISAPLCPTNSHRGPDASSCICDQGYVSKDGSCVVDNTAICQRDFGAFVEWAGTITDGKVDCACQKGYEFSAEKKCVPHLGYSTAVMVASRPKKISIYDFTSGKRGKLLKSIPFDSLRVQAITVPSTNILITWEGGVSHPNIVDQASLQLQGNPDVLVDGASRNISAKALRRGKTYSFRLSQKYVLNGKVLGGGWFDVAQIKVR